MADDKKNTNQSSNVMRNISIDKVTLNVGAGKDTAKLDKGIMLLKNITGVEPVKTVTQKRIPAWSLRPGLPIGCKITLRGKKAKEVLTKLLVGKNNTLPSKAFDNAGNVSFGIHEYIDVPTLTYDPKIGIMGFEISVTLKRPGFRVKNKKLAKGKIGKKHLISKENSIEFFEKELKITVN